MLLEKAIADAYGAGFEYVPEEFTRENNKLDKYYQHPKWLELAPNQYTDDTQMSVAVAEVLLSGKYDEKIDFANAFVGVFQRDHRAGYAAKFYEFLQTVVDGEDFLARIQPNSDRSGGAMRAGPCGLLPSIGEVKKVATLQASLTHNTVDGLAAAQAAALMVHYFHYKKGNKAYLPYFLNTHVDRQFTGVPGEFTGPASWSIPWEGRVLQVAWQHIQAAVTSIVESETISELVWRCSNWGGDVDTVAAIAVEAASFYFDDKLPDVLVNELENGSYGREFLIDLDKKLLARYPGA